MSQQPVWKFIVNLGNANPIENGGYFIFEDDTDVYSPEAELFVAKTGMIYRFLLDRHELHDGLIPYGFSKRKDLPYPLERYAEWFNDSLRDIANFTGFDLDYLISLFTNENVIDRALAYRSVGEYHGFENLDSSPKDILNAAFHERYDKFLLKEKNL